MDGWLHNLNPFAIRFYDEVGIRWYGLAYLTAFVVGYLVIRHFTRLGRSPLSAAHVGDFVFAIAVGTIVGGRLGYCIFYSPNLLTTFTKDFPFWGVLALHHGGMASHGGMIGIVVACLWFARKHSVSFPHLCDLTTIGATVGIFFGRIANFINGELVGRPVVSPVPWAVKFPQDIVAWPSEDPARLSSLSGVVEHLGITTSQWQEWIHQMYMNADVSHRVQQTLSRIIAAVQNGDLPVSAALKPLLTPRHPSQLYAALLEGLLLFLIVTWLWRKPRPAGLITGVFLLCYGIVRIIGEEFRMPDAQLGFQLLGLTRGQWLSTAMLVIGPVVMWRVRRSPPASAANQAQGSA